jgi:hypothetical protein
MSVEIKAKQGDGFVTVLVDDDTAALLAAPPIVGTHGRVKIGSHGYPIVYRDNQQQLMHRWLLGLRSGDGQMGDHLNGDKLDNRRANLRIVTPGESSANVRGRAGSGFRGVYPNHKRWAAAAKQHGKKIHLGTYDTPEEAYTVATDWRRANLPGWVDR